MGIHGLFHEKEYKKMISDREESEKILTQQNEELIEKLETIQSELKKCREAFTPEMLEAEKAEEEIKKKQDVSSKLSEEIYEKRHIIEDLSKEVIELEETKLMQDFGLYQPMYDFSTSTEYKERLSEIRKEQKRMIKEKTAAICRTEWTVNGSKSDGKKMTISNIKQTLITFNVECENAIDKVTFSNFESMEARISRIFEKLNNLNEVNEIVISSAYLDLKYQELHLAYEYKVKKQEEKEYAREQREIQRENAKVQKELEEERKRIEKEQAHYNNQMQRLLEQLQVEENEARKSVIQEKIDAVEFELEDLDKALKDVDYRQANERAGYVYIISNIGAFGEGVYKIGMTRRLEPMDRIDELGGASVPFRFDVHALIFSSDAPKLETALHNAFADRRVNKINLRKEYFRCDLKEIEEVVRKNHDKTVDFIYTPCAEQYRESMKM